MTDPTSEILQLREKRLTPKQIAHKLGMKVSAVSAILRDQAEAKTKAFYESGERPPIYKCLIDQPSAQQFLGLDSAQSLISGSQTQNEQNDLDDLKEWDDLNPNNSGLAQVIVARQLPRHQLTCAVFLVDCWCLGVKNAIPPRQIGEKQFEDFVYMVGAQTECDFVEITLEQAQSIVWGGIDYARSLGFEPHADFESAKELLGDRPDPLPVSIEFGRDGKPFYFAGPYDDSAGIIKTLRKKVGAENFDFVMPVM